MPKYEIASILQENYYKYANRKYIFEKKDNAFFSHTYNEFVNDVYSFAGYLQSIGVKKAGICGENSYPYMVADITVMGFVGICAALSRDWGYKELAKAIDFLKLDAFIYSESKSEIAEMLMADFSDMVFIQMKEVIRENDFPLIENYCQSNASECSKIIFSSGTTGVPKAVMLSQENMFANRDALCDRVPMSCEDSCYLFLPLHHVYGGISNFLYSIISGMSIYLCSDSKKIIEELQEVKPTIFCAVPLVLERIYEYTLATENNIADILGGRIKFLFNGGASFKPEIRKFYKSNGINLIETYGLSETSSTLTMGYSNDFDLTSAGTPLEGIMLKILDGEVSAKGKNVFLGYYKNEVLTKKVIDENGYFHTGDLGYIKDNKLYITGRKKREIVLANGENICPDDIEALFENVPSINKVKVYEKENNIHADVYTTESTGFETIIGEINSNLPKYARIKSFNIILDSINIRLK